MRKTILVFFLLTMQLLAIGQERLQLAPPLLRYSSAFFSGSTTVSILFDQPGAKVHYTLDGKEPGSYSTVYTNPITIRANALLKVKAIGNNFIPSETVQANFTRKGIAVKEISYSKPNDYYTSAPKTILQDAIGGMADFRNGNWLGYQGDTATITIELPFSTAVKKIVPDFLLDQDSWIFLPESIQVYYYDEQEQQFRKAAHDMVFNQSKAARHCKAVEIAFTEKITATKFKLAIQPLKTIPEWHAGKGQPAWFFIDEINLY